MADKKITQLNNITGANLVDADEFVVVDISADETKAITLGELKEAFDAGSGFVRVTGDTMTGNLGFGDNDKAIFGAGSDLQIYHDGSNSYIDDVGTGGLRLRSPNAILLEGTDGTNGILVDTDGEVQLYYNGASKLQTTASGIDVTGTVTADSLTVDGSLGDFQVSTGGNQLSLTYNGNNYINTTGDGSALNFRMTSAYTQAMKINSNNDISFYEDTGTTPKFFWDASTESLGIGVVPSSVLHVKASTPVFTLQGTAVGNAATPFISAVDSNSDIKWRVGNLSTGTPDLFISSNGGGTRFTTGSGYTEAMRIDYSGKVGIGTASPAHELSVVSVGDTTVEIKSTGTGDADALLILDSAATGESEVQFFHDGVHGASIQWYTDGSPDLNISTVAGTDGVIDFQPNNSLAMRIDSSGNLLVGKTTQDFGATGGLEFYGASGDSLTILSRASNAPLQVRRNTTDGDIVKFQKDGTVVGSIGTAGSTVYVGSDDTNIIFDSGGTPKVGPAGTAGAASNGVIDLGDSGSRFKDLYLSGGAYLGGTGAANKLDDYEEGTWTATSGSAGSLTVTYGAYYTKVGNTVTLHLNGASFSDITSTGNSLKINGLPFTAGSAYAVGHTLIRYRDDDVALICFISGGGTQIRFYKSSTTGSFIELNHTIFNSSSNSMFLSITYQTT